MASKAEQMARELFEEGKNTTEAHKILNEQGFKHSISTIRGYYAAYTHGFDCFTQYKHKILAQSSYENDPNFIELSKILEGSQPGYEPNHFIAMLMYLSGDKNAKIQIFAGTEGLPARKKLEFIDYLNRGLEASGLVDIDTVGNTRYITGKGHEILQKYSALSAARSLPVPAIS